MGRHRNMIIAPLNFPSRSLFCRAIHNNRGNVVARINRVTPANKPCGEGEGGKRGWTAESPPRLHASAHRPASRNAGRGASLDQIPRPAGVGEEGLIKLQVAFDTRDTRGSAIYADCRCR